MNTESIVSEFVSFAGKQVKDGILEKEAVIDAAIEAPGDLKEISVDLSARVLADGQE